MKSIYAHFDRDAHYLCKITKLCHTSIVTKFITTFKQWAIFIEGLINYFYMECFTNGPKEESQALVLMQFPRESSTSPNAIPNYLIGGHLDSLQAKIPLSFVSHTLPQVLLELPHLDKP